MCPLLLTHYCTILTQVMSITSHKTTEDQITPKPSLGQTEQILMYHFTSTHLVTPCWTPYENLPCAWSPKLHILMQLQIHKWQKNMEKKYPQPALYILPITTQNVASFHNTDVLVFSLSNTMPSPFFTELSSKQPLHTPCHCMGWVTGTVKPPQLYQWLSPCQRPEKESCLLQD